MCIKIISVSIYGIGHRYENKNAKVIVTKKSIMIRWLHISDLHLNDGNFSSARLRDELPSFLRNKRMKCDYVFCTGDIRSANVRPNSFTEDMADYMRNICHAVGVPIERLFIVPGNHDVNIFAEGREDAIKHIVPYDGYYKPDYGHIDTVDLEKLQSGKEDFVDFLSELYDTDRIGLYKDSETRSHTDGFQRNNAKCLDEKGISRFVPHSSI